MKLLNRERWREKLSGFIVPRTEATVPGLSTKTVQAEIFYGCFCLSMCTAYAQCQAFLTESEFPKIVRGKLAGTGECDAMNHNPWKDNLTLIKPKRVKIPLVID